MVRLGGLVAASGLLVASLASAQGVWESRAGYPIEATEVSSAAIESKVYAMCGITPRGSVNALFIYDRFTDTWKQGASIPISGGADHCNVAAVVGKLYLLGGLGDLTGRSETYEYDPAADRWRVVGRMPTPRGASGVAAIGTRIYVAGGLASGGSVAAFEVFDTATGQWSRLPDMPTARDHLTAQAVNGNFYAISGRVGDVLAVNEEYDPATNAWRSRAPILTPRGGLGSGTLGNRIQVFGGEGPSGTPQGTYRQNEEYDPRTDTWRSLASMPNPRHGLYGATAGCVFTPSGGPIAGANYSNVHDAFCLPPAEPPAIEAGGVRNAASFTAALSAGTLVSLFGQRLAPFEQGAVRFPLRSQMASVIVKANGSAVPLVFVGPGQINFHLPYDVSTGPLTLTVTHAGAESAPVALPALSNSSPGIFTLSQDGQGQGAILIAGTGILAGPGSPFFSPLARPARKGEVVEIYCTGLGRIAGELPAAGLPAPAEPLLRTAQTPSVTIGGAAAELLFSGLAPGFVGVYQVNARVPASVAAGPNVPLMIRMGENEPPGNTVTLAVAEN